MTLSFPIGGVERRENRARRKIRSWPRLHGTVGGPKAQVDVDVDVVYAIAIGALAEVPVAAGEVAGLARVKEVAVAELCAKTSC